MTPGSLPPDDLDHVLQQARNPLLSLSRARLFITGGTGFFGHWLLESLLHANRALDLHLDATVLTRSAAGFHAKAPHITGDAAITLLEGDVQSFDFPTGTYTHIVHAATDSGGRQAEMRPGALAKSILKGTQHVLDFAHQSGARRFLYTSTGAVYGRSTTLPHTPEHYGETHAITLPPESYEAAKRMAEELCVADAEGTALEVSLARCFAFVGPHLPLDQHFAIGNFIRDAMAGTPIHIKGDGTPRRSFLYMSDLAVWLWTMLVQAPAGRAYNVGSDESVSIAELAQTTAATLRPGLPVQIDGTPLAGAPLNSYVPDVSRAASELGLRVTVPLTEAIRRTAAWHGYRR